MDNHIIKLIDSQFSTAKTKAVLLELLICKINFHAKEKFSNEVRFGVDQEHSEKRIIELQKEKEDLILWLNSIDESAMVRINCNVTLGAETMRL